MIGSGADDFFMLVVPVAGLWASAIGVVGLEDVIAAEDTEFKIETFYTNSKVTNEGMRGWIASTYQPH